MIANHDRRPLRRPIAFAAAVLSGPSFGHAALREQLSEVVIDRRVDSSKSHWISRVRTTTICTSNGSTRVHDDTRMTYWLRGGPAGQLAEPNLTVRIYQTLPRSKPCLRYRDAAPLPPLPRLELARRWQKNMMLNKWFTC
jgi:hypothetical protein